MTDPLNLQFFEPHLEQQFQVEGAPVALKLVECRRMKSYPGEPREPFALLFRGPAGTPLQQQSYALTNDKAGKVDIFLVPVGRDADGFLYEAVFN